jgi:hypothetical protein
MSPRNNFYHIRSIPVIFPHHLQLLFTKEGVYLLSYFV